MEKNLKANYADFFNSLEKRFQKNQQRHENVNWNQVHERLEKHPEKIEALLWMEDTGGEPDVIGISDLGEILFCDFSEESPKGRRSLCYDQKALESRKEHKPKDSAIRLAEQWGLDILNEEQYRNLQKLGKFDFKTSSWLKTPDDIRQAGGAIFGDWRYGHVFIYHNGAESYYASRGFRCLLKI